MCCSRSSRWRLSWGTCGTKRTSRPRSPQGVELLHLHLHAPLRLSLLLRHQAVLSLPTLLLPSALRRPQLLLQQPLPQLQVPAEARCPGPPPTRLRLLLQALRPRPPQPSKRRSPPPRGARRRLRLHPQQHLPPHPQHRAVLFPQLHHLHQSMHLPCRLGLLPLLLWLLLLLLVLVLVLLLQQLQLAFLAVRRGLRVAGGAPRASAAPCPRKRRAPRCLPPPSTTTASPR